MHHIRFDIIDIKAPNLYISHIQIAQMRFSVENVFPL